MGDCGTVFALEPLPERISSTIFLAGPTPRGPETPSWRPEAVRLLREAGYAGTVLVPEDRNGEWRHSYDHQVEWECRMRACADLVVFWIPRDLETMPALTTNVEFGEDLLTGRCLYGRPDEARKNRYLDSRWTSETGTAPHSDLKSLLSEAAALLKEGAERTGTGRSVPLSVWRLPSFQAWLSALEGAGGALWEPNLLKIVPFGPSLHPSKPVFAWIAKPRLRLADGRTKDNEVVVGRTDCASVVPVFDGPGGAWVLLACEPRAAARNAEGIVVEWPGGSSPDPSLDPRFVAVEELAEEAGLRVDPARLVDLGSRQSSATLCSHAVGAFAVRLTREEADEALGKIRGGAVLGADPEAENGERVLLRACLLEDARNLPLDWSALGVLSEASWAIRSKRL